MTRELDAEVLHFEDRRHVGAGLEAVGAYELDLAQRVEALGEHLGLGGVGERRVGDHAVSLAVALKIVLVDLDGSLRSCDRVGDAFGDDVQAEHRDHDHEAREQCLPPAAGKHAVARVGEDVAPRRRRLGDASGDEGERRLEHDGVSDEHDGKHEHRGDAVAHDMLPENPGGAGAGDDDGAHVILVVLAHHVRAHDAGNLRDVEKADGEDERGHAVAEHNDECRGESDAGEGHDDVQDAHDDIGDALAHNGGDGADDGADHERERRGAQADGERVLGATHQAGQNVAPLVVGAKEVFAVRRGERGVDRIGIIGSDEVGEDGDGDDRDEHDKRDARANRHVLPTAEAHFAGAGLHLLSEVATKLSHGATPS